MPEPNNHPTIAGQNVTTVERKSPRELVVTRTVNAPARLVFEAWSKPELLSQWWVPKSCGLTLVSCEADVRVGGRYRLVFRFGEGEPMAVFGTYTEVTPPVRLAWTNEETGEAGQLTTVTFHETAGKTLVVLHELYPTEQDLDAAIASGSTDGMPETFDQLAEFLAHGSYTSS